MPKGVGYGSNIVAGTGLELNVVGNFAYGYSGQITAFSGTDGVAFDFTTGSYIFLGKFHLSFDKTGLGAGESFGYTIKFNGNIIARLETEHQANQPTQTMWLDLMIPAFTHVEIIFDSDDASEAFKLCGLLTGKIFK